MTCDSPSAAPRLLLVDGHAFAYRAFFAIRRLSSPSGAPTNAIYGFIKMLEKMRAILAPTHLLVVWDGGLAEERTAAHPEYKSQRAPMPSDLEKQIEALQRWLPAAGLASYCEDGVEADDWIAAMTRRATAAGLPVVIASTDKDFMQLLDSERVGLLNTNDKSEKVWGAQEVRVRTGVVPEQIVDWLSLIGDNVDNIPGVPGVGPKTAADLLQQFGSVECLYTRLSEVKSDRLRASLEAAGDIVRRNQRLIRLKDALPVWPLERALIQPLQTAELKPMYAEWGFKSLLADLSAGPEQSQLF
jgi:DNA polymerase-1